MTAAESVALAGKMWLYEDDTRTYLGSGDFPGRTTPLTRWKKPTRSWCRNTGGVRRANFATWWMDLGATGWFDDPRMWAEMKRLAALDEPLLAHPRPFRSQVAAVIDQRSMMRLAYGSPVVARPGIYEVRLALGRMGARTASILKTTRLPAKSKRNSTCCCRPGV